MERAKINTETGVRGWWFLKCAVAAADGRGMAMPRRERERKRERLLRSLLPMQSESLTTSNCPAWPVRAVKSEREQTTRRLAISRRDGSRRFDARRVNFRLSGRYRGGWKLFCLPFLWGSLQSCTRALLRAWEKSWSGTSVSDLSFETIRGSSSRRNSKLWH